MADWPLPCPDCDRPMEWKGFFLSKREEDEERVRRFLWALSGPDPMVALDRPPG